MNGIIWITFETPSVKDCTMAELVIKNTSLLENWRKDYLKLIKDREGRLLWIVNKLTYDYMFISEDIDVQIKDKIVELLTFKKN